MPYVQLNIWGVFKMNAQELVDIPEEVLEAQVWLESEIDWVK